MQRSRVLGLLCAFCFLPVSYAANVTLEVEGLSGELDANVHARLSSIPQSDVVDSTRFRAQAEQAIRLALRALGYFQPTIEFSKTKSTFGRDILVAKVTPGEPVRIAGVNIQLSGEAKEDRAYSRLIKRDTPELGSVLNQGQFDDFLSSLNNLSLRRGYFDATVKKSELGVAEGLHKAYWNIDYDSGARYHFGEVIFHGAQIRQDYLQNLVPFHSGDYYSSDQLAELNRRLSATGWFNSVVVTPALNNVQPDHTLPLEAVLRPRTKNFVETGVGYASDTGPRVKVSWKKPWLNDQGQSLQTSLNISGPEQTADFSYKIPLLKNPLEQYYLLQGGFKRENLNDTESDSTTLNVARYWELSTGWKRAINLRWSLDHFTQASISNTAMLLYPGVSISRTRQRGGIMPVWGDSQFYSIDVSRRFWGSDIDFAVFQAQNVWIRSPARGHRFVLRGNLGWIETNDFNGVPPSLRFFAGGERSIRGYAYKSISPKDSEGQLTGASKLATGSLEYQYNLKGNVWGTLFVDSGEAVNDIRRSNFKTGVGAGVLWASPFGPVKVDIATPVGDRSERGIQLYLSIGPEL